MAKPDPDRSEALARVRAAHAQELAHAIRHDARAPLRHVDSFAQLVRDRLEGKLDPKDSEFLDRIVAAAHRADAMLVDLVKLVEQCAAVRVFGRVALGDVVAAAVEAHRTALERAGARVEIGELADVHADRAALETLFRELVANALAYRAQRPLVVSIAAEREGSGLLVRVRDNGRGFDPSNAEYIFGAFQRVGEPAEPTTGSGVGLTLARWIAQEHGGTLTAASVPGEGATFTVSLPDRSAGDTSRR